MGQRGNHGMTEAIFYSAPLLKRRPSLSLDLIKYCLLKLCDRRRVRKCWVSQFNHAVSVIGWFFHSLNVNKTVR